MNAFNDALSLKKRITLVLDDPAGNSYVQVHFIEYFIFFQSLTAPLDDPRLEKEFYTRTYEQNDELGLNDMKVDNYAELDGIAEEDESENDRQFFRLPYDC